MSPETRSLIAYLLATHVAEMRVARNLAREHFGLDHPLVGQHEQEVRRAQAALEDFEQEALTC
jgi:hypothetical protein